MKSQTSTSKTSRSLRDAINSVSDAEREAFNTKLRSAATRLREHLSSIPWHAERAARAKAETGDDMTYWMKLAVNQPNY